MILPPLYQLSPEELAKKKKDKIFLTNAMTLNNLKAKVVRYLNKHYPAYELTEDSVRLWKANMSYYTVEKMAEYLAKNHIGGPNTKVEADDPQNPDIENNTGVEFPGT